MWAQPKADPSSSPPVVSRDPSERNLLTPHSFSIEKSPFVKGGTNISHRHPWHFSCLFTSDASRFTPSEDGFPIKNVRNDNFPLRYPRRLVAGIHPNKMVSRLLGLSLPFARYKNPPQSSFVKGGSRNIAISPPCLTPPVHYPYLSRLLRMDARLHMSGRQRRETFPINHVRYDEEDSSHFSRE